MFELKRNMELFRSVRAIIIVDSLLVILRCWFIAVDNLSDVTKLPRKNPTMSFRNTFIGFFMRTVAMVRDIPNVHGDQK